MMEHLFQAQQDYVLLFIRLVAGVILFPHGMQKLLGWYGGAGIKGTLSEMKHLGIPVPIAFLVVIGQSLGSISLLIGFLGHIVAACLFVVMAGAMVPNIKNGWLMNWEGKKQGEGIEYFILLLTLLGILTLKGSGAFSIDLWLFGKV